MADANKIKRLNKIQNVSSTLESFSPLKELYDIYEEAYGVNFQSGSEVGIQKSYGGFRVWSDLDNYWYERLDFDDDEVNRPSNRMRRIMRLCNVYPAIKFTRTGANSTLDTATTGTEFSHLGGQAARALSTSTYFEVDVTGGGDLYISYTARTSSGHVRVDINESQSLVNEISDLGNGYKAFDSYSSVDLQRKRIIKVASNLPQDTYTIKVSCTSDKNASSTDTQIYIEAVAITTNLSGAFIEPPQWQSGLSVTRGEEYQNGGYYYRATTNGTTGETAPTHTSSTSSDGGVTWQAWTETTWYIEELELSYPSEREYAIRVTINGADEIGGQTHSNENSVNLNIFIDNSPWDYANENQSNITSGSRIRITEDVTWLHLDNSNLATLEVVRVFSAGVYSITAEGILNAENADFGWWYVAMMPALRWSGGFRKEVFDECRLSNGSIYSLDDAAGLNPTVLEQSVRSASFAGNHSGQTLVTTTIMPVEKDFFLLANINSIASASGSLDWTIKGYFKEASILSPKALVKGQSISMRADHYTAI